MTDGTKKEEEVSSVKVRRTFTKEFKREVVELVVLTLPQSLVQFLT
jgi:hypothetical protein